MRVQILRHWVRDEEEYGEYYIYNEGMKYLCFQNGDDIKVLGHWVGKSVKDCLSKPTEEAIEAIKRAVKSYHTH